MHFIRCKSLVATTMYFGKLISPHGAQGLVIYTNAASWPSEFLVL